MLKSDKRWNVLIALLIAIGLWAYVMGVENPEMDVQIKNVPITFVNEDTLRDNDLVRLSVSNTNLTVTVNGHRSEATEVDRTDIRVVADLEGLQAGENTVPVRVTGKPDSVKVVGTSLTKVTVVVDEIVTEEKAIVASLTGSPGDDREPYIVQLDKDAVAITGAQTLVDSVKYISAVLDVKLVENELRAISVDLLPVDAEGNTVEGVTLKEKRVSVTAVMLNKKTVPLEVPVIGAESGGAERTVSLPKTITIKGYASSLYRISSITAEPIDLSRVYEDTAIPVVPILPDGIEAASNSQNLKAQVKVEGLTTRNFTYGQEAIIVEGLTEDVTVSMADTAVILQVVGVEEELNQLMKEDFYFIADVEGLEPGVHQVQLECKHEKVLSELTFTPMHVTVTITPVNAEDGETDADSGNEADGGQTQE